MKIIKKRASLTEEESITIVARDDNEKVKRILEILERDQDLILSQDHKTVKLPPEDVYYIESIDFKTYVYSKKEIYRSRLRLYEMEKVLPQTNFLRINRQTILNLRKISSVASAGGGRIEVHLKSGDKLIVSRQYAPLLKERFGL